MNVINQEKAEVAFNADIQKHNNRKNQEATITGIILFVLNLLVFIKPVKGEHIIFFTLGIILALARIPIALWCSTIAKRKNRNHTIWGIIGFFFPALTLIILPNTKKSKKINIEVAQFDKDRLIISDKNNVNNLPLVTLPLPSALEIESLSNDNFTLKYMIKNYSRYEKETGLYFPLYAAVELNNRGEKLDTETINSLNKYATEKGYQTFYKTLESINQSA